MFINSYSQFKKKKIILVILYKCVYYGGVEGPEQSCMLGRNSYLFRQIFFFYGQMRIYTDELVICLNELWFVRTNYFSFGRINIFFRQMSHLFEQIRFCSDKLWFVKMNKLFVGMKKDLLGRMRFLFRRVICPDELGFVRTK